METQISLKDFTIGNIDLNKTQLNYLTQTIFNIQPYVQEYIRGELNPLQAIANKYILSMQEVLKKIQYTMQLYEERKKYLNFLQQGNQIAINYAENANKIKDSDILEIQKEIIVLTDLFTLQIQQALGKNLSLVYVYQSKQANVVEVYEIKKIQDILKIRATSKGSLEVRLHATKKELSEVAEKIPREIFSIGQGQAKLLDITYKEIIRRYNTYRNTEKYKSLILWNMKSRPKWHGMFLSQKGDLTEAYMNFVVKENLGQFSGNVNNPPETDIETFMKIVEGVDAVFGGIQGDISWEQEKMQIAVKTLSAQPQGILQTIQMAKDLLTGQIDINNFNNYKKKWERQGRNKILEMTEKQVKKTLKEQIGKNIGALTK